MTVPELADRVAAKLPREFLDARAVSVLLADDELALVSLCQRDHFPRVLDGARERLFGHDVQPAREGDPRMRDMHGRRRDGKDGVRLSFIERGFERKKSCLRRNAARGACLIQRVGRKIYDRDDFKIG